MRTKHKPLLVSTVMLAVAVSAGATIDGSLDPDAVVEQWSDASEHTLLLDINFSDTQWPDSWAGATAQDCPSYDDGGYVNAVIETTVEGDDEVTYPIMFRHCTFANKSTYNGYGGTTAAFARLYYNSGSATGNSTYGYNNWTAEGHTYYIEDNMEYDGSTPIYGEAGFVQMCRDAAEEGDTMSMHGWVEIDHLPYVSILQWAWSSTSWGRGIKCDYKVGSGEWEPLVWMGSEKQKQGYTVFSDQGYFMENEINASDVSLRWRVWDGDTSVQLDADGNAAFSTEIDSMVQKQAPRLHKIKVYGTSTLTADDAEYARLNPLRSVGEESDLSSYIVEEAEPAPDDDADIEIYVVAQDGTGDYTTIQDAIDAVSDEARGLIYIRPGTYEENLYSGTASNSNKFISLIGEDATSTVITSSVDRGDSNPDNTYNDCAALNVYTDRFYAENLTISNTAGDVGQAEALFTSGDAHLFNKCVISGYQDTYKANVGARGYYYKCVISGATDFIYDSGLEWFEACEIQCLYGGSYITAAGDAGLSMTSVLYPSLTNTPFYAGLFFRNCEVTCDSTVSDGSYYLGRPWKERCGTMFLQCTLGNHIHSAGWASWNGNEDDCSYLEYLNLDVNGDLVDTSDRASFSAQADEVEVAAYMNPEFLFDAMSSVPFDYETILAGSAVPTNFSITDNTFTWEGDDMSAAYLIYKDDEFVAFTQETSYTMDDDDDATYSVAAVSRHGVVSDKATAVETTQLLAFPTAEGFGKYASGGRGGQVVYVTSLADDIDTEGTLRWALAQYPDDPLTIVFAVSGEIALQEELSVSRSDFTIAGQTAPGDGIVITHNKVDFGGSDNFIVRNMRFRIGQKDADGNILAENAVGAENCSLFIFDHCSFGWSVEENMNTADSHFLTVQYSIVHEGLYNAGHSKGVRGYGAQWGGSPATYHHNLLAHNSSRSTRFNGARGEDYVVFLEYINNVNFNYATASACYGGENTADITIYNGLNSVHECNFINNYYQPGPASPSSSYFFQANYARDGATSWAPSTWFAQGNVMTDNQDATDDNWTAITAETYSLDEIKADERIVTSTPYYKYSILGNVGTYTPEDYMLYDYQTATEAYETVLAKAGTINRDKVEERIISDVTNNAYTYTGSASGLLGIIDLETDAEGFFDYSDTYTVPTDTDLDGMPDDWETDHDTDPLVADNNTVTDNGYTALEVYLYTLMGDDQDDDTDNAIQHVELTDYTQPVKVSFDAKTHTLYANQAALGSTLRLYNTIGQLICRRQITQEATTLTNLPRGIIVIRIDAPSNQTTTLKTIVE